LQNKRVAKTPPPVDTVAATKKKKKAATQPTPSTGSGAPKRTAAVAVESDALAKAMEASSSRPAVSAAKPNNKTGKADTPTTSKSKG
jgi:hypothetical protein